MNFENEVKNVIESKLSDGTIKKVIEEEFEKSVRNSVQNLFSSYGDVTKVLQKGIKAAMIERIERQDFSKYLVKMDMLLQGFIEQAAGENLKLAKNFKGLMLEEPLQSIKRSELFNMWMEHVAKVVETNGLDVETDDTPHYEPVEVTINVSKDEEREWSCFKYATVYFECEHDESVNVALRMWSYRDKWTILPQWRGVDLNSLRKLSDFEVFLMRLAQDDTEIEMDGFDYDSEWVTPEAEPESSWS